MEYLLTIRVSICLLANSALLTVFLKRSRFRSEGPPSVNRPDLSTYSIIYFLFLGEKIQSYKIKSFCSEYFDTEPHCC